jgi:hypothetical protein
MYFFTNVLTKNKYDKATKLLCLAVQSYSMQLISPVTSILSIKHVSVVQN